MTFAGRVDSASRASRPDRGGRAHLITTYPLRITNESDRHRQVEAPDFVLDLFGFSCASDEKLVAVGYRFVRNGDLIELDAIATGSGVLVVRQPRRVTVVTDLAGVWPVFYATVAGSLIYSSSAEAIAAQVGREVDTQWLTARLVSGSVPETWAEGSPYQHVRAVPAGGVLIVDSTARPAVVRRELPLASTGFTDGAQRLAEALGSAVCGRMQAHREISMDLSGGLDSSAVVALAAATRPESTLPAITLVAAELGGDDPAHARKAAAAIPGLRHLELPLPGEVDPYTAARGGLGRPGRRHPRAACTALPPRRTPGPSAEPPGHTRCHRARCDRGARCDRPDQPMATGPGRLPGTIPRDRPLVWATSAISLLAPGRSHPAVCCARVGRGCRASGRRTRGRPVVPAHPHHRHFPSGGQVSLAHDLVTDVAAALDYESYVRQHDGSLLTQSTARDTILHMCQMMELEPGLRVLEVGTGSGYTSALLGGIVGEQGSVVSLNVDSSLIERARTKHAQGGVGNVTVHATDGYAGWATGAPYDRIIGWAAPHLLPRAWVEQAANRAVIVTPVKVAPIAQAHLLLRVDLDYGQPIPRDVHAGGFIEMHRRLPGTQRVQRLPLLPPTPRPGVRRIRRRRANQRLGHRAHP